MLKRIKSFFSNSELRVRFLEQLRYIELYDFVKVLPSADVKILEVGAGAGWQSRQLKALGYNITAIDIPTTNYKSVNVFPVEYYDGVNIPFKDASFDVIYSSHTMEHVKELDFLLCEMRRVLKINGFMYHTMPSSSWQFWSLLANFLRLQCLYGILRDVFVNKLLFPRHGELGNSITEVYHFRLQRWKREFERNTFKIRTIKGGNLFYTGKGVFNNKLDFKSRRILSSILGSSANIFILEK